MRWFFRALKKYAVFSGRARRREFWFFFFFAILIFFSLDVLDQRIGTFSAKNDIGLFGGIFLVAILIPSLSVQIRRLHDIGRSGWWSLLNMILPSVGTIVLLFFALYDSQPGTNRFGPNPKDIQ